jgi:hypothetical protein
VDGRVIERDDVLAPPKMHKAFIASDKREAFAQGSVSDDLSAEAQRAKAEAIHP